LISCFAGIVDVVVWVYDVTPTVIYIYLPAARNGQYVMESGSKFEPTSKLELAVNVGFV
jgi:hypothetical protein